MNPRGRRHVEIFSSMLALFSIFFWCCFLVRFFDRFGIVFGGHVGSFFDQNSDKFRICDVLKNYDFPCGFPLFSPLGGSYVRLILALFSVLFFDRFLIDV